MIRPEVSVGNYSEILRLSEVPPRSAFDYSLSEIIKKYHNLENFYKKHGGKK